MPNAARQLVVCVIFIAASTVAHTTRWPAAKLPPLIAFAGKSVKWKITIVYNISSRQKLAKSHVVNSIPCLDSLRRLLAWPDSAPGAVALCCLLISISVYSGYVCQYLIKCQIPSRYFWLFLAASISAFSLFSSGELCKLKLLVINKSNENICNVAGECS